MSFFAFIAGFFRESGATESSTRLVGIFSFGAAILMSLYAVIMIESISGTDIAVIAMNFSYGCIALGLRKGAEPSTPNPAVS